MNRTTITLDQHGAIQRICSDQPADVYIVAPHVPHDRVYLYGSVEVGPHHVREEIGGFAVGHMADGALDLDLPVSPRLPPSRPSLCAIAPHPDADLLALCARLAEMQEEWQRLWQPTSEDWKFDQPPITEADHIWQDFNDHVWPAIRISGRTPRHPDDVPGRILDYQPATPEGVRAKAAAVLAMEDAACYGADCRNDACEMFHSVLVDAAGPARCLMGEDRK